MVRITVTGVLIHDPIPRAATGGGSAYATATLRTDRHDGYRIAVGLAAHQPAALRALLALKRGARVLVSGRAKFSRVAGGATGISLIAESVLAADTRYAPA